MTKHLKKKTIYMTYAILWFFVNLLTLNTYPLMHSDESWLAALTATMMAQKNLLATEPFFDLAPRAPHTLKTLYHLLQMPFISMMGYQLSSVRLLSLIFATGSLVVLILLFDQHLRSTWLVVFSLMVVTLNSQFIYAAHFARQEMALVFILLLTFKLYDSKRFKSSHKTILISGLIGLSISFHPNAFIIALMLGMLYLVDLFKGRIKWPTLILYTLPMGLFALANLLITFSATNDFLNTYWQYASTLSVGAAPQSRGQNFIDFYIKIYHQISGTYFLPTLTTFFRLSLLAGFIFLLVALWGAILIKREGLSGHQPSLTPLNDRKTPFTVRGYSSNLGTKVKELSLTYKKTPALWQCLLMAIGFNCALYIIGRYNPTSIVFLTLVLTIFLAFLIGLLPSLNYQLVLYGLLIILTLRGTYTDLDQYSDHDYANYVSFIEDNISDSDIILGNLSGGFAMAPDQFYDIRNLPYLNGTSLKHYIQERQINTIIYYEEYDYIHRNPSWQILYGDDAGYYDSLQEIIEDHGSVRAETVSPYYGNRIIRYLGDYPWQVKIIDIDVQAID